jgi:hypothetical protein
MAIVVSLFLGLTVSAEEIIRDRKILQRERFLSLSRFSYINSKVMIMFVLSAIQMLSFVLIGNFILGIQGLTFNYFIVLYSTSCFANMLGLNISSALNSVVTIYILIPFILVPQLLLSGVIVKFDKLHKSFASYKFVPFVGDLMTSRWAFEALAVTQYKDNKWEKNFFDIEKKKSYAEFKFNYLIPELINKLDGCEKYLTQPTAEININKNLLILKNEIELLDNSFSKKTFKQLDKLNKESFNSKTAEYTRNYLESKKKYFTKKYNESTIEADKKYTELSKSYPNKNDLITLKEDYFSNGLSDLVTNKNSFQTIYETDDRLIQMTKPIYKDPESNYGRAHFYAPYKNLFGKKIDTLWFNTGFIWFTTLFLYIALIFDWLKKLLNMGDKIKFGRKKDRD